MSRRSRQLRLEVRMYLIRADGFGDIYVQAGTRSAAQYKIFKKARAAGYFPDPRSAFRDFLAKGWRAREVRR